MFIVFSGLPGSGKSSIAVKLAARLKAVYLRIDSIEQGIREAHVLAAGGEIGPAGYLAAYRLAADNLRLGLTVIADSVNPLKITRDAFQAVARGAGVGMLEVEIVCSNAALHRRRVETRPSTVAGLTLPTWEQVEKRDYEAWHRTPFRLDTALLSVEECVDMLIAAMHRE
ncbi:AAA family ATPase [Caballeronia insecticola]|uniref:Kinase-like protein n=1 Tax=Caballeronia insecticola TaxID=758793 RepID=R4WX76_9BURK|nr:AAA family ATPase [Caballeronia insecticola]BAN23586.1 kinase-like protein [Caballeronia insecticola]